MARRHPSEREARGCLGAPEGPDRRGRERGRHRRPRGGRGDRTGVTLVEKLGDVRYVYSRGGERIFKVVSFFLLRYRAGRIGELPPGMELEVAEARWLPLDEAPRLLAYGGEREMAKKAAARLATL